MMTFMMSPLAGGLASGGLNLLGGIAGMFGQQGANAQNAALAQQQMMMQQNQFNQQMNFAQRQLDWQNYYANNYWDLAMNSFYHGVSDRVADAQAAGISPLVALGMQPANVPAMSVGVGGPSPTITGGGGNAGNPMASFAQGMSGAGQDISRAINATRTPEERALTSAQTASIIKDNDVKDAHITQLLAQANAQNAQAEYYSRPIPGIHGSVHPDINAQPKAKQGYADEAYKTTSNTMEYQAAPGTTASQSFVEGALATVRNRAGGLMPGDRSPNIDPGRVMSDIRKFWPDAVGYKQVGLGNYTPVFPEDQVKEDIKAELGRNWLDRNVQGGLNWIQRNFRR